MQRWWLLGLFCLNVPAWANGYAYFNIYWTDEEPGSIVNVLPRKLQQYQINTDAMGADRLTLVGALDPDPAWIEVTDRTNFWGNLNRFYGALDAARELILNNENPGFKNRLTFVIAHKDIQMINGKGKRIRSDAVHLLLPNHKTISVHALYRQIEKQRRFSRWKRDYDQEVRKALQTLMGNCGSYIKETGTLVQEQAA